MIRPLYQCATSRPIDRGEDSHSGLWFDKFCDRWRNENGTWTLSAHKGDTNPKLDWIRTVVGESPIGSLEQIEESTLRILRLLRARDGLWRVFMTEDRFVTGLGRSHPIENGFAWHATLGTSYLPGSSVKGLVRAWAEQDLDTTADGHEIKRLLGDRSRVGTACFLDALPTEPVWLEADIMTPHYAGWTPDEPPGDWCSSTPIPFLVTAAKTPFLFGILPRAGARPDDLEQLLRWMTDALTWSGAGAKTAVGYGRFRPDERESRRWTERLVTEAREEREALARNESMRTPEGPWRLTIEKATEGKILDMVRINLEKEPLDDLDEIEAFVTAVLATGLPVLWRRGKKRDPRTQMGKKKLKERARLLDEMYSLTRQKIN